MTKFLNISTDNTLGGNSPSDALAVSQKAIKEYVDAHGGGGSVSIDDSTITRNSSQQIQAVATINANSAAGATNPIYDWVGTLSEYETQDIATTHPDWICYIVDDLQPAPDPITKEVVERNIGELVYSLIPVTDAGLHLLDGEILSGEGIYADFYNYMVGIQSSAPQIFCSEADWQASVSTYGACGKFVLDTANHTIRLPKVTGFVEGTITSSELGSLVEAGLPNITGTLASWWGNYQPDNMTGAFIGGSSKVNAAGSGSGSGADYAYFSASGSNPIYGKSTTVQPQAIKGYVYMVLANTVKTDITVDIDQIATDLNNKASIELLNAKTAHVVVEFQEASTSGQRLWYRKYADGWVEQGGYIANNSTTTTVTFPVAMKNTAYSLVCGLLNGTASTSYEHENINTLSTTGFKFTTYDNYGCTWLCCGIAAS